jgi:aminoglycoside phosphotransferase (APT) family kinase protein
VRVDTTQRSALHDAVTTALRDRYASDVNVVAVSSALSAYSSSFRIEDLNVGLSGGEVLHLTLKDLSWHTMLDGARSVRSHHAHDPEREVSVYRRLLPDAPPGPPKFYGAAVDPQTGTHWLFIERVAGLQLRHVGDFAAWEAAARWIGELHGAFGTPSGVAAAIAARLPTWKPEQLRWTLERARAHTRRGDSPATTAAFEAVAARHEGVVDRLIAQAPSLIHGQLYPANIVFHEPTGRVCVLDWETAAIGPPAIDVAALTEGSWSDTERSSLVDVYLATRDGVLTENSRREFALDVTCARVQLALDFTTLPREVIPVDMAADWLRQAAELAEMLPW